MTVRFALRVPAEMYGLLKEAAQEDGLSMNEHIVTLLGQAVATRPRPDHMPGQQSLLDLDAADEDD